MHGLVGGTQVYAGQWQQDALRDANEWRRSRVDSDFEQDLLRAQVRAHQHRLIAVAAIAFTTITAVLMF